MYFSLFTSVIAVRCLSLNFTIMSLYRCCCAVAYDVVVVNVGHTVGYIKQE